MTTSATNKSFRLVAAIAALLAALATILALQSSVSVEPAFAQGAGSQYDDGDTGPGGGSGGDSDLLPNNGGGNPPGGDQGPNGNNGDAGGGNLPFTGYPLSTLVLLLLILLASGLTLRGYVAARDRLRARSTDALS